DGSSTISILLQRSNLTTAMNAVLKDKNVKWHLRGKAIIISWDRNTSASSNTSQEMNQQKYKDTIGRITVKGRVVGEDKKPLPGVTVRIKGKMVGTITDENGAFILANVPKRSILIFRSIGFETYEVDVVNEKPMIIELRLVVKEIKSVE